MRKKVSYLIVAFFCILPISIVLAAQDPIGWTLTKPLPAEIQLGSPSTTTYTLTNHLPSVKKVTVRANNAAATVAATGCDSIPANGGTCNVTLTFTPTIVGKISLQLMMLYGITAVPLPTQTTQVSVKPTPTPTPTPTPGNFSLTAFPMSLNFSMPGEIGEQSILFRTSPLIADEVIVVSNLPSGITGASSCTTDSSGTCSINFIASKAAYGNAIMNVSAAGVNVPPSPIVSVDNTTIRISDSTYIPATGTTTLMLSNIGNFDWKTNLMNAIQFVGDEENAFGVDTSACIESNVEAHTGTCMISFTPTSNAHAGDGVKVVIGGNGTESGNGNVYINGGVTVTVGDLPNNTFTDVNQTETMTLKNTSNNSPAIITDAAFKNDRLDNIDQGGTCGTFPVTIAAGSECTITYTSRANSYGSDSILVNYMINSYAQTVESAVLTVAPTSLILTPNSTSGSAIASGSFINLAPDSINAQSYIISGKPFDWQNTGVTLTNAPTDENHSFSNINCGEHECTVTFNTNVMNSTKLSINGLNFNPDTIVLNVSGSNIGETAPSWNVAPVVGEYMQGGVVYWVGTNDTTNSTVPGYRKALVAAIKDAGYYPKFALISGWKGATLSGFFAGPNDAAGDPTATGLANTNTICAQEDGIAGKCKITNSHFPAEALAQQYTVDAYQDWFLPAASFSSSNANYLCTSNTGELCELYMQRNIVNAVAKTHQGNIFNYAPYWSSTGGAVTMANSERALNFNNGTMSSLNASQTFSVRPVRAFSY